MLHYAHTSYRIQLSKYYLCSARNDEFNSPSCSDIVAQSNSIEQIVNKPIKGWFEQDSCQIYAFMLPVFSWKHTKDIYNVSRELCNFAEMNSTPGILWHFCFICMLWLFQNSIIGNTPLMVFHCFCGNKLLFEVHSITWSKAKVLLLTQKLETTELSDNMFGTCWRCLYQIKILLKCFQCTLLTKC